MSFREERAFYNRDKEMIPKGLLRAMLGLVLLSLAFTTYAVVTHRPLVGVPAPGQIVGTRAIILDGHDAQAVTVRSPEGAVLADLPHGGFVTVIQNALATERHRHGIDPLLPVNIVKYDNGRFTVEDPATGWSAELYAFGGDNKAAWERLYQTTGTTP
jgi:putative photosynthetic complex assembly protein